MMLNVILAEVTARTKKVISGRKWPKAMLPTNNDSTIYKRWCCNWFYSASLYSCHVRKFKTWWAIDGGASSWTEVNKKIMRYKFYRINYPLFALTTLKVILRVLNIGTSNVLISIVQIMKFLCKTLIKRFVFWENTLGVLKLFLFSFAL